MIQEVLIGKFGGQYESGSLNQPRLGKQRRASILRRVYFGAQVANDLAIMQNLHCHHPDQYRRELARRLEDFHCVHADQLLSEVRDSKHDSLSQFMLLFCLGKRRGTQNCSCSFTGCRRQWQVNNRESMPPTSRHLNSGRLILLTFLATTANANTACLELVAFGNRVVSTGCVWECSRRNAGVAYHHERRFPY